jgi:hypothetical protein
MVDYMTMLYFIPQVAGGFLLLLFFYRQSEKKRSPTKPQPVLSNAAVRWLLCDSGCPALDKMGCTALGFSVNL